MSDEDNIVTTLIGIAIILVLLWLISSLINYDPTTSSESTDYDVQDCPSLCRGP